MAEQSKAKSRPSDSRSADSYINAVNAVLDLVEIAAPHLKNRIDKTSRTNNSLESSIIDARKAAERLSQVVPVVAPVAKKAAGVMADKVPVAVGEGAEKVAAVAKGAAEAAGGAIGGVRDSVRGAIDMREQEKARKLARKTLLDGAGIRMSAEKFMENWETQERLAGAKAGEGYLAYPGCYVAITCNGAVKKDDYSKYRELFVGKSENMGASIHDDFVGRGNPDVYADVKYKQHVYVLLYPCAAESLDELERSLVTALDADESYNGVW